MVQLTDSYLRAIIVYLKSPFGGKTTNEIAGQLEIPIRTINDIYARAIKRGFDPNYKPFTLKPEHVQDASRSGRPSKQTEENAQALLEKVRSNRYGRELPCTDLAGLLSQVGIEVSSTTVWRILRSYGFHKTKPTRKPGLTKKMRAERLKWCLDHKDWTLEDN
jgi:transposase